MPLHTTHLNAIVGVMSAWRSAPAVPRPMLLVCLLLLLSVASVSEAKPPGASNIIEGPARVVDGDTLWIGEQMRSSSAPVTVWEPDSATRCPAAAVGPTCSCPGIYAAPSRQTAMLVARATGLMHSCCLFLHWLHCAGKDKVRLYGIDAPEKSQSCTDEKGQTYSCGKASTDALQQIVGKNTLRCEVSRAQVAASTWAHTTAHDRSCAPRFGMGCTARCKQQWVLARSTVHAQAESAKETS